MMPRTAASPGEAITEDVKNLAPMRRADGYARSVCKPTRGNGVVSFFGE
jgi:hypothetical protein